MKLKTSRQLGHGGWRFSEVQRGVRAGSDVTPLTPYGGREGGTFDPKFDYQQS